MEKVVNTWTQENKYETSFFERLEDMFSMLNFDDIKSVLDLGCGNQWARKIIPHDILYIPVDIYKHLDSTIVKDLNMGEYYEKIVDLTLCSGIFEYIYDLETLIKKITSHSKFVLFSYHFREITAKRSKIWVNNYSINEIFEMFAKNGFALYSPMVHTKRHNGESYCIMQKI